MAQIVQDWRKAELSERDRALCAFAEKLTREPQEMQEADLAPLRAVGLGDQEIHDATQVIAYFNYINRIADALGVTPEDFVKEWEKEKTTR